MTNNTITAIAIDMDVIVAGQGTGTVFALRDGQAIVDMDNGDRIAVDISSCVPCEPILVDGIRINDAAQADIAVVDWEDADARYALQELIYEAHDAMEIYFDANFATEDGSISESGDMYQGWMSAWGIDLDEHDAMTELPMAVAS